MKIILDADKGDLILQVRAAKSGLKTLKEGQVSGIAFEGGKFFGLKRNKDSIRVYPQQQGSQDG
jgi:hypothetical protein